MHKIKVVAPQELWLKIQEPRAVNALQCLIYLVTLTVGVIAFVAPPSSIQGAVGLGLTATWSAFLMLGGLLGAVTVLPGVWWLERVAIVACGTGAAIYASIVVNLHLSEGGNRLPQAGMLLIVLLFFAKRWVSIRRYAYDPEK